jgi:hypothetical protein
MERDWGIANVLEPEGSPILSCAPSTTPGLSRGVVGQAAVGSHHPCCSNSQRERLGCPIHEKTTQSRQYAPSLEAVIHTLYHKVGQDTPANQPVRRLNGAALTHRESPQAVYGRNQPSRSARDQTLARLRHTPTHRTSRAACSRHTPSSVRVVLLHRDVLYTSYGTLTLLLQITVATTDPVISLCIASETLYLTFTLRFLD